MRQPNVLIVTRELTGDRLYGIGRSIAPVADALSNNGWHIRYLCQEDLPAPAKARRTWWLTRLASLPGLSRAPNRKQVLGALAERLQMGWFAAATAKNQGFTSVHLHDPWLAAGFWLGLKALRVRNVRWGITEHGFGSYSRATHDDGLLQGASLQRWLRRMESIILSRANWVTAPTQLALDELARDLSLPFNPTHWRVIPHFVQPGGSMSKDQARQFLGWTEREFHLLGIGRLVPLKRFDILVGAFAIVASRHPSMHLHLLGDGDRPALQQIADTAGVGDRISFSVVDDVRPYLAAADVYVSTSSTESFGLANFEALLAGLPCVCTAVGGVPEVMGPGAWLIPLDQSALVQVLEELFTKPDQLQLLSARAHTQARKFANLQAVVDQYVELFKQ